MDHWDTLESPNKRTLHRWEGFKSSCWGHGSRHKSTFGSTGIPTITGGSFSEPEMPNDRQFKHTPFSGWASRGRLLSCHQVPESRTSR